jgi:hypothetical protein
MEALKKKIVAGCEVQPTGCWEWTGGAQSNGYGRVRANGRSMYTHRAAYTAFVGPIPSKMDVCHRCDNRICCNPAHLFIGSRLDNMRDAKAKGRIARGDRLPSRRGERNHFAKLSWESVREIRRLAAGGARQKDIAAAVGVDPTNISQIVLNKTWRETA